MKHVKDSFAKFPSIKFSVEQKYYTIADIENGIVSSSSPTLDFDDDPGLDDDDFDEICRQTYDADNEFEQSIIDEKNDNITSKSSDND